MPEKKILVIEDEYDIAQLIHIHLSELSQQVTLVHDGQQGLDLALHQHWDVIVLDLRLPHVDGLEICRQIRNRDNYVPILMLTAKSTELDRVLGLELGADDYLTKPFSVIELSARVKALLRRFDAVSGYQQKQQTRPLSYDGLEIDADQRSVKVRGKEVRLTAKEFDLLWFFASHPARVFNRNQLLDQVWGYGHEGYEHTVNSHMNRLRTKIESDNAHPRYIETIWGVGYKFIAGEQPASHP
jgi:DNA-binding response OmpR family regulator